jgi:hypothetical protein
MITKESKKIIRTYNKVARALIEYETLWHHAVSSKHLELCIYLMLVQYIYFQISFSPHIRLYNLLLFVCSGANPLKQQNRVFKPR